MGHAEEQLVEVLRYKPEGRAVLILDGVIIPGVESASNRNGYKKYIRRGGGKGGRCVGLKTLLPTCADCYEIWEPRRPGTVRVCSEFALLLFNASVYGEFHCDLKD
jgi:hypothetical protein